MTERSPLRRIPAIAKLAFMLVVSFLAFANPLIIPAYTGIALVFLALFARLPISLHLKNIKILMWYTVFIVVFRFAGPLPTLAAWRTGLFDSGIYIGRLALVLLAGTIFYETTSTLEIRHALYSIQGALYSLGSRIFPKKGRNDPSRDIPSPDPDIALLFSLTISFIPRIFATWSSLNLAWNARGGNLDRGIVGAWRRSTILVPLLIVSLLEVASVTDRAIRNRSR